MVEILSAIALGGIFVFLAFKFIRAYEEAKKEGYIYDGKKEEGQDD